MTGFFRRALALFCLLCAIYFFTYTGHPVSTDELQFFDAARSLALYGTVEQALTFDLQPFATLPNGAPVPSLTVEPLQLYLVAPLVWLAERVPGLGVAQAVWLFNIPVTALTGVVLYAYGLLLGYPARAALGTALIVGLGTIVWPYTQLFFREPLLTLLSLCAAYAVERWRRRGDLIWIALAALAVFAANETKDAGLSILPVLILLAVPDWLIQAVARQIRRVPRRIRAAMLLLIAVAALVLIGLIVWQWDAIAARFGSTLAYLPDALPAYLISPGFSVWAFSPVLLLALVGAFRLARAGRWREVLAPLILLGLYAVGHATVHGTFWYGGLGWGPRFLVPVTPFLALWLLPILRDLFGGAARQLRPGLLIAAVLIILSIGVQIVAVSLPTFAYSRFLSEEGERLGRDVLPWIDGVWNPAYNAVRVNLGLIGRVPSFLAWDVNHTGPIIPILCALVAAGAVYLLLRPNRAAIVIVPALLIGTVGIGMRAFYLDPRYGGADQAAWKVLEALRGTSRPSDTVLVNSPASRLFVMNYYKARTPLYVLPTAQGETVDPDEPPYVVSTNPEEQADPYFQMLFARLAARATADPANAGRWLYWTEYTPFTPNRLRVTEHYLARHYFPLGPELVNEPTARLLPYAPIPAPPDRVPPWPSIPARADFGPARLIGVDLPHGLRYAPGDLLPISLLWEHPGWPADLPPFEYSVNVTLIGADGLTRAQRVAGPLGTFAPMTLWQPGAYYRDNHALAVPEDIPPGEYELWVLLTDWRDGRSLPRRDGAGDRIVVARVVVEGASITGSQ